MRIGIDAAPLFVRSGGIRRYTEELIHGLTRLDARHRYILYRAPRDSLEKLRFSELARDPFHFPYKSYIDTIHLVGARRTIDLYHGTNYSIPLLTRIPTVVTIHDLTVQLEPESHPRARRMRHQLLPMICRRATRIIADSGQTRDDLVRLYHLDERKIDVVHLGVASRFRPVSDEAELVRVRATYALPEKFILYLGALEPRKNLEALIDSIALLWRNGTGKPVVIAGSGTRAYESRLLAHVCASGLTPGHEVHFPGHIEERDLAALYSASDLFVFPSRYEGFGLPPLEAMACGVPVVLAGNSSLMEVYEGTCTMFDGSDAVVIADAIHTALADESQRMERLRRGLELVRSRSWDNVCVETLAVYERAVQGRADSSVQFRDH